MKFTNDTEIVPVTSLVADDLIDLEGDPYADPNHAGLQHVCEFAIEYVQVGDDYGMAGESGESGFYVLFVQGGPGVYCFPADHGVSRMLRK